MAHTGHRCLCSTRDRLRFMPLAVLLLFLLLPLMSPAGAAEVFVSALAGQAGDGSSRYPFASLAEAQAATGPGDTIYLVANDRGVSLDGAIRLQSGQRLLGVTTDGAMPEAAERVRVTNSAPWQEGVVVALADGNEIAGIHFHDMSNAAIAGEDGDYSGAHIHDVTFTGNAAEHVEDERGLVYAISLLADGGVRRDVIIEDSSFYRGDDLGAIRIFHSGDSEGDYLLQGNDFSDLGGRPVFVRSQHSSRVSTRVLDSSANNIGLGERNSDSIIPYLMGQSEQVMLVRNYHFRNTLQVGNQSNTAIEAFMFGYPRDDQANWCTACRLNFTIEDSLIETAVTDSIQFSNSGRNSQLNYVIRNTRIIGGTPRQGGGGISLNLQSVADSGSRTTLLVEGTEVAGTDGYGFAMNNRGGGNGHSVTVDLGGGPLGSRGNNRFSGNARGDMRLSGEPVSAAHNAWDGERATVFNSENEVYLGAPVDF